MQGRPAECAELESLEETFVAVAGSDGSPEFVMGRMEQILREMVEIAEAGLEESFETGEILADFVVDFLSRFAPEEIEAGFPDLPEVLQNSKLARAIQDIIADLEQKTGADKMQFRLERPVTDAKEGRSPLRQKPSPLRLVHSQPAEKCGSDEGQSVAWHLNQ